MSSRDFSLVREHLAAASRLGLSGVVVHTAGKVQSGAITDESISVVAGSIRLLIDEMGDSWSSDTRLLLETSAGSKSDSRYGTFHDLTGICNILNSDKVGICLDTAHCFANGYSVEEIVSYDWKHVKLVHFNNPDKNVTLGSHLDRHEGSLDEGVWGHEDVAKLAKKIMENKVDVIFEREHAGSVFKDVQKYFAGALL